MATASVDLTPVPVDLLGVRAGDTNAIPFTLREDGALMNLTGAVVTAQARKTPTDAEVLSAVVIVNADPATGQLVTTWDGELVRTLLAGQNAWTGVWDMQVTKGAVVKTVAAGKFTLVMDVTR